MSHETRKYDLEAMRSFVSHLDSQIEAFTQHAEDAKATASRLLAGFDGATAGAFSTVHEQWQNNNAEHLADLRRLRDRVNTAYTNYLEAQRVNDRMLPS